MLLGLSKVPRPLRRLSSLLLSHLPSLTVLLHTLCSLSRAWALYNGNDMPGVLCFVERKGDFFTLVSSSSLFILHLLIARSLWLCMCLCFNGNDMSGVPCFVERKNAWFLLVVYGCGCAYAFIVCACLLVIITACLLLYGCLLVTYCVHTRVRKKQGKNTHTLQLLFSATLPTELNNCVRIWVLIVAIFSDE